jgi:hypothetical protein
MKAKDDNRFAELQRNSTTQNKELWQGWVNALYNPYKPITLQNGYHLWLSYIHKLRLNEFAV